MEREKLKDKIVNFCRLTKENVKLSETVFNANIVSFILFSAIFYFVLAISKNLFLFLIINVVMLLAVYISREIGTNTKTNFTKYLYVLLPCYSIIYIANNRRSLDLFLWLFLLTIFSKISYSIFNNTLENVIVDKSKLNKFMGHFGSVLMGVFIGLIAALLLKQKIFTFMVVNVLTVILIGFQEKAYDKINIYLELTEEKNKFFKCLLYNYNNLVFTSIFVAILLLINVIK